MSQDFVHLHVHTQYSLLDGAIRFRDLFQKAVTCGMSAIAITDHGNMFGAVEFYETAKKYGVKPILGCEVYVAPHSRFRKEGTQIADTPHHLILLAMDGQGYKNLIKLVTLSYLEGFYYKPRIDKELLRELNQGLIALSACLHGEIPYLITRGDMDSAVKTAREYSEIFTDRFYLELQANGLPEQDRVNRGLLEISHILSLPLVATNDCHYLKPEDANAHDVLLCIQTGKSVNHQDRMKFSSDQLYLKSPEEMYSSFKDLPYALESTVKIAEACNLELDLGNYHFPKYSIPEGKDLDEYLYKVALRGLEQRIMQIKEKNEGFSKNEEEVCQKRLETELDVIRKMGFSSYFLIVSDFINYAKRKGIPVGPGRGSAAGSLVAYALGITDIDPITHGLLFERFLSLERMGLPDIDVDFCMDRRDEVIKYVSKKYGDHQNVAQIITFGKMQARAVIRDVGRAFDIPYSEVDRIAKLVPNIPNVTLDEALAKEHRLKELSENNPKIKELLSTARALEGLPRHASIHAAGVVISDKPIVEHVPLYKGQKGEIVTQYDMKSVERVGLIKFDFLGLKTLTVIDHAIELINKKREPTFSLESLDMADEKTYALLGSGDTTGVFQLESSGMRDLVVRIGPESFSDLIALIALYRPGPLESGMLDDFIKRKHREIPIHYELPQLEDILKDTYGVIVYQEQVMKIASILADYTLGEADILRHAMGKKNAQVMREERNRFLHGAKKGHIPLKKAERVFNLMEKFGGYGFNKSHSAAYALIAYQTAYLKAHYPLEFMAALLTSEMDSTDDIVKYIGECREKGIEILPPDVNESERDFTVVGDKIRFGLAAVKNVGTAAIESIISTREKKDSFSSLFDFCQKVDLRKVNKKVIESLIKSGAFDFTGAKRSQLMFILEEALEKGQFLQKQRVADQINMFGVFAQNEGMHTINLPEMDEWQEMELLALEKETLGFYISGHPLAKYKQELQSLTNTKATQVTELEDGTSVVLGGVASSVKEINSRRGDRMAFVTLEDLSGFIEIIVFSDIFKKTSTLVKSDMPILVRGHLTRDEKSTKVVAEEITPLSVAKERMISSVRIKLNAEGLTRQHLVSLRNLLEQYKGTCKIYIHVITQDGEKTVIGLPDSLRLDPSQEMIQEINDFFGYTVVETKV